MEIKSGKNRNQPEIYFSEGRLKITGRSLPGQPEDFFQPLISEFNNYVHQPREETSLELDLELLNCGTKRSIMQILNICENIAQKGKFVQVKWKYRKGDELMQEQGAIFQSLTKIPFSFEEVQ